MTAQIKLYCNAKGLAVSTCPFSLAIAYDLPERWDEGPLFKLPTEFQA